MTGPEKKSARMAMARLNKASAMLRAAAALAEKANAHGSHGQILEASQAIARATNSLYSEISLPSKRSAEARTLPLFK